MLTKLSQFFTRFEFLFRTILAVLLYFVAVSLFENRDLLNDDNINAYLTCFCIIILLFGLSGTWDFFTDNKSIPLPGKRSIKIYHFTYLALSVFFAIAVYKNYSNYLFDDSAFTLRYLDNFWEGYFYHYNASDPPVFGISCFTFGVFTGFWCWLHLLTPEQSIYLAGFVGLIAVSYLNLRILRSFVSNNTAILLYWFVLVFSSKMFLNVAKSGMESSFHVSFVFAALLFFFLDKRKWLWLFLALCIISKLDTVPFVVIIGSIVLLQNKSMWKPLNKSNIFWREFFFYAVLPMGIWVLFAFLVFGSPLPQSAYSKIFLHYHPSDYWFPFLKYYVHGGRIELVALLALALFVLQLLICLIKPKLFFIQSIVFGLSFIGIMLLFYFYNPGEQMAWYYVLPDLLLLLQLISSFDFFIKLIPITKLQLILTGLAMFLFVRYIGVDVIGGKYWMENYLECVERERLEVGKFVGERVGANDSIMSNHGLPVRHVKGYVIDMSGLNSKYAADFKIDPVLLFQKTHPQWAISHNSVPYAALLSQNGYAPVELFYDITQFTFPQWCLYKKLPKGADAILFTPVDSMEIKPVKPHYNGGIVLYQNDTLSIMPDSLDYLQKFCFGVKRAYLPFVLQINFKLDGKLVQTDTISVRQMDEYPLSSKYTKSVMMDLLTKPRFNTIELCATEKGKSIEIIEPYILRKK